MAGGSVCYLGQIVGSLILCFGTRAGIYIGAIALIVNFCFLISGSWLLIMGTLHGSEQAGSEQTQAGDPEVSTG
jgi:hypothetical protein